VFQHSSDNKANLQTKFKKTASKHNHGISFLPLYVEEIKMKSLTLEKKELGKILSVTESQNGGGWKGPLGMI